MLSDSSLDPLQILEIRLVAGPHPFTDHQQTHVPSLTCQRRQRLDQRQPAFAGVEKAEVAEHQLFAAVTARRPLTCPLFRRKLPTLDIVADRNPVKLAAQHLLLHRFPVTLIRNHNRIRSAQRQPRNPVSQPRPRLGKEIGNAQIVICPGGAQPLSPQEIRQSVDGRMHPIGRSLVLNVNPFSAGGPGTGRDINQDPPAPAAASRQHTYCSRVCGPRNLLVAQDGNLRALHLQSPSQLSRKPADATHHRRIFTRDEQHLRMLFRHSFQAPLTILPSSYSGIRSCRAASSSS